MEARAHQAELAEASLAADLRTAEAHSLSSEGVQAKCATLEERLSEMRAEQVSACLDYVLFHRPCWGPGTYSKSMLLTRRGLCMAECVSIRYKW